MTSIMVRISILNWLYLLAIFVFAANFVGGKKCTNVLGKNEIKEVIIKQPCVQKYTARCGWFSLDYCDFYHNTFCDKKVNETVKKYYVETDCCRGFFMAKNGTCIKMKPGVTYNIKTTPAAVSAPVDPNYKADPVIQPQREKRVKMEISGGGYAGIACGLILIVTIVVFIVLAVRKRKKKKEQMEAVQTDQVLYVGPTTGNQPIVRNSGYTRTPSAHILQNSREATPSSSRMVTAPTSPIKATVPVEVPLLNKTLEDEDIPESNV